MLVADITDKQDRINENKGMESFHPFIILKELIAEMCGMFGYLEKTYG